MKSDQIELIRYNDKGLVPVIVQHFYTGRVLMCAYANREAIEKTLNTGEMFFFSRSRQELWHKGSTSGNTMELVELQVDCDGDCLLARVKPMGPACHTGAESCFYRTIEGNSGGSVVFLEKLYRLICSRKKASPETSYTSRLFQQGVRRISQKIGEEGVETALALSSGGTLESISESADLIYHLLVGLAARDITLEEVVRELESRHGDPR